MVARTGAGTHGNARTDAGIHGVAHAGRGSTVIEPTGIRTSTAWTSGPGVCATAGTTGG